MKYLIIFFILSSGVQDYSLHTNKSCFETGEEIMKKISIYHWEVDGKAKLQGWYTPKGELVYGFYCDIG